MKNSVEIIPSNKTEDISQKNINKLRKAAAYCRVSTGSMEQLNSYNSQKTYYKKLIENNENWTFAGVYADEAITGTKVDKRKDFKRMIDDAISGQIDLIICKSISRFARNTVDTLQYVRILKEHNVEVYFEEENIKTLSMDGELLLTILSSVAQQEVENISEHVKAGLKHKMTAGQVVGFSGCLGYDYDPAEKIIKINEEEAEIVRYIYKRYLEGAGCKVIGSECEKKGWKTKRGGTQWYETTVLGILKNEKYKGDLLSGKTITVDPIGKRRLKNKGEENQYLVRNHHEGIISEEEWYQAQEILKKRKVTVKGDGSLARARYSKQFTFSSKLECGFCGKTLTRRTINNASPKTRKVVWQCVNYVKNGKKTCANCKAIKEKFIEDRFVVVFNLLLEHNSVDLDAFIKDVEVVISNQNNKEKIKKLEKKIKENEKKKNSLIEIYIEKSISKDDYTERYKIYDEKIKELRNSLKRITDLQAENDEQRKRLIDFKKTIKAHNRMEKFDPVIFDKLVEKVIVGGEDESGFPDPYMLMFILKIGVKNEDDKNGDKQDRIGLLVLNDQNHQTSNEIMEDNHQTSVDTHRDYSVATKTELVEILYFKHFYEHFTFGETDWSKRGKRLEKYLRVAVAIELVTVGTRIEDL